MEMSSVLNQALTHLSACKDGDVLYSKFFVKYNFISFLGLYSLFNVLLCSLRVALSVKDERVYAIVVISLLSYITSVPNFWNLIYEKLFVK